MSRKRLIDLAMRSVKIEGFDFTMEEKEMFKKIGEGKLPLSAVDSYAKNRLKKLRKESPECFI